MYAITEEYARQRIAELHRRGCAEQLARIAASGTRTLPIQRKPKRTSPRRRHRITSLHCSLDPKEF